MSDHRTPVVIPVDITLADRADVYNFRRGMPLVWDDGRFRRETWRDRLRRRLLWWRRPMSIVTARDVETGTITLEPLCWSWLRWKWVRR